MPKTLSFWETRLSENCQLKGDPAIAVMNNLRNRALKESQSLSQDSHPEFQFMTLNPSETQMLSWITLRELWKTTSFGHKKLKRTTLISLIDSKTSKPPNTSGSDAQTQESLPMKLSALNQENFLSTETSRTKPHCQILTLWQLFNTLLNIWRLKISLSADITDAVVSELPSREKTMDLWSHGFHTSEIWGPDTEKNSANIIKKKTKTFWWNWTLSIMLKTSQESQLSKKLGKREENSEFTDWFTNFTTESCTTWRSESMVWNKFHKNTACTEFSYGFMVNFGR